MIELRMRGEDEVGLDQARIWSDVAAFDRAIEADQAHRITRGEGAGRSLRGARQPHHGGRACAARIRARA